MKNTIIALMFAAALAVNGQTIECVCKTNTTPYVHIPTTNTAWLAKMTSFVATVQFTNPVTLHAIKNIYGRPAWGITMDATPGVWQLMVNTTATEGDEWSRPWEVNGNKFTNYIPGTVQQGLFYARRIR